MKEYNSDDIMKNILMSLASDFGDTLRSSYLVEKAKVALSSIPDFRRQSWPTYSGPVSPYLFKANRQIELFLKRYRFENDLHSDAELKSLTLKSFLDTQRRVSVPLRTTCSTLLVLQEARKNIKRILGEYSVDEVADHVRFGSRACYGVPFHRAYLHEKMDASLPSSRAHSKWFVEHLHSDSILSDAFKNKEKLFLTDCASLALSLVPKSFKSLRIVKPQTVLGNFYTNGLGSVLQDRLLKEGLDIRRLQAKHGRIVKKQSKSGYLATADLSAASDSITYELLGRLLPRPWLRAVMLGTARYVNIEHQRVRLSSIATMGDGHTFPLQTLIFYSLLKAIRDLKKTSGTISVYGDDLIYPASLHHIVVRIFSNLHFIINEDKTYADRCREGVFRESCGSDYYRGCDVRPFCPEGGHHRLYGNKLRIFIYKLINGLRRRWDDCEISRTLKYLYDILIIECHFIHQVPMSYPDTAGIKLVRPSFDPAYYAVTWAPSSQTWVFSYLRSVMDLTEVDNHLPYYWDSLRMSSKKKVISSIYDTQADILLWNKKRSKTFLLHKVRFHIVVQTGSTSGWTEA